ncbi:MAG: ABC transporter permease [Hespellia sp.]|nr:ABC transporter permease [Hespellia sp.]
MRMEKLIAGDVKFQRKYGFYFLYAILTIIYITAILAIPQSWRGKIVTLLIFSDPPAMGMFFMGAIVLLEKSQRVLCTLAVSPITPQEYIASKMISVSLISLLVAVSIALAAGKDHLFILGMGTVLTSMIFTLLGMIVAVKIESLNQFILWTVPFEIIGFGPAVLYLFGVDFPVFQYYPANICINMVAGRLPGGLKIVILCIFIAILFGLAQKSVLRMWNRLGGAKL